MDVLTYNKLRLHGVYRNVRMIYFKNDMLKIIQEVNEEGQVKGYTEINLEYSIEGITDFEVRE